MTELDLNPYQAAARDSAIGAMNDAVTWDVHPSYNNRRNVLHRLTRAEGALLAVRAAEGGFRPDNYDVVAGVSLYELGVVTALVKDRKGTTNGAIRNAVRRALFPAEVSAAAGE